MLRHETTLHSSDKIVPLAKLNSTLDDLTGASIVLVGGCFDIFHFGHLTFLNQAREEGDILMILLESDEFILERKGRKPVHTQDQRAAILASLIQVDYVVLLPHMKTYENYLDIVKSIKPKVIAVTENDPSHELKKKQADQIGAQIKVVTSHVEPFSSRAIKKLYETFPGN